MTDSQDKAGVQAEVVLYDADAVQTIFVEVTRGQRRYPTYHTINPCSDEKFVEFDKLKNVRVVVAQDKTISSLADREKACGVLYRELLEQVKGWGDTAGSNVDESISRMVVEGGLFICAVDEDGEEPEVGNADEDRPWERSASDDAGIPLRCRFNGEELVTRHFPQAQPSGGQRKRYDELKAKKKVKPGGSLKTSAVALASIAKPLGKLYRELFDEGRAEGYKPGTRVPLWHMVEAVSYYMERDEATVGES